MNKHHITINQAKQLPQGETILWLKDNKYYIKANDGIFDQLTTKPMSESECKCLNGTMNGFCFMPCPIIKDLYIVESDGL